MKLDLIIIILEQYGYSIYHRAALVPWSKLNCIWSRITIATKHSSFFADYNKILQQQRCGSAQRYLSTVQRT